MTRKSSSPRYLYLIRHGQYFDNARTAKDMKLTALGREQLQYTGKRLDQMNITFTRLIHSGMVRAVESAEIINEELTRKLQFVEDRNLTEGLPVAPIPYAGISQEYVDVRRASFSASPNERLHWILDYRRSRARRSSVRYLFSSSYEWSIARNARYSSLSC